MFDAAFIRLALIAAVSASVSLGILGVYLAFRRLVFLGLVVANAATVGAALGAIFGWNQEVLAAGAAILSAIAVGSPSPRRVSRESIMGWAYATAAAATVLMLAKAAAADADVFHLLYGNLLAVSDVHAAVLAAVAIGVAALHAVCGERFALITFDEEGARLAGIRTGIWSLALNVAIGVAVALAVQHIGALLTFALLTMGPMAALLLARSVRATFLLSAAVGSASVVLGIVGSLVFDLPPGPMSVSVLALAVVAASRFRAA